MGTGTLDKPPGKYSRTVLQLRTGAASIQVPPPQPATLKRGQLRGAEGRWRGAGGALEGQVGLIKVMV